MTAVYAGFGLKLPSKRRGFVDALQESYRAHIKLGPGKPMYQGRTYRVTNTPRRNTNAGRHSKASLDDSHVVACSLCHRQPISP